MRRAWLVLAGLAVAGLAGGEPYCLAEDDNPYLYYATKTAYQFVYDHLNIAPKDIPNCKPVQIWMVARHGTRNPKPKEVARFSKMEPLRDQIVRNNQPSAYNRGELCYKDVEGLRNWRWKLGPSDASKLTPQGWNELFFLAKRMKTNFRDLLETEYSPSKFTIRFAESERTHESSQAFAEGLFGKEAGIRIPNSFQDDDLLKPEMNCTSWEEREESPEIKRELELFETSLLMKNFISRVSRRLGFTYNLTLDIIDDMYGLCRYEKAWNNTATSPWCAVFHREELQILEYAQDLKYYYSSGYGNDLTLKLGCPLVRDLMENFRKVAMNESDTPRGFLYFVHSLALRAVVTRLGIAQDVFAPTHSNYNDMAKRQWKTSFISPFSGNLAAIMYKCSKDEENMVMLYLGEHEIDYEGCKVGLCSWNYLWDKFKSVVDPTVCSKQFCHPANTASTVPSASVFSVIILASLLIANGR